MQLKQKLFLTLTWAVLCLVLTPTVWAGPLAQGVTCEKEVVVQADDWLSKIAEKVYGSVFAYPAIVEATNVKNAQDNQFAKIDNPDMIEVGWKLCLPSAADAASLLKPATAPALDVAAAPANPTGLKVGRLVLATTTSTQDSGLLEAILPDFEVRYGAEVEVIAVGTGQAIELGKKGDADVLLVHARKQEDAFVADGYGVNRQDVMYNDFVVVGPPADPVGIKKMTDVTAALTKIAETKSIFISRGDNSGTHTKELDLWGATKIPLIEASSVISPEKKIKRPEGDWYLSVGQGMGATLTMSAEKQAYTLSDRATYLARKQKGLDLEILVEGDSRLFNPYGVIAVNPDKQPQVNTAGAQAFIEWITAVETQQLIGRFGIDKFGASLFTPNSAAWKAAQGK